MRTRKVLWRWRHNPLKRRSDRLEAWAGLVAGAAMLVGAPVTGVMASDALGETLRDQADLTRTKAVLTENAPSADSFGAVTGDSGVPAKVRWETADGRFRTARAPVEAGTPARTEVTVWLDKRGVPRQPPPKAAEITGESAAAGSATAVATCFFIGSGCWLVRRRIDAVRAKEWEQEWAAVGPWWSRRE
jgi:hypothetical protein